MNQQPPKEASTDPSAALLRTAGSSTDPHELTRIAEAILNGSVMDDGVLTDALIENLNVPFAVANLLTEHWWKIQMWFGCELCSRPDATPEALDDWCLHSDQVVTDIVARHPNTTRDTLLKMVNFGDIPAIASALKSGKLPDQIVGEYADSERVKVRAAVAMTSKKAEVLKQLATDSASTVRIYAVSNPCIEVVDLAERALVDEDATVVAAACKRLTDPEVIRNTCCKWWKKPRNEDVIKIEAAVLANDSTPDDIRVTIQI